MTNVNVINDYEFWIITPQKIGKCLFIKNRTMLKVNQVVNLDNQICSIKDIKRLDDCLVKTYLMDFK